MNKKTQQKLFEYIADNLGVTALYDQLIDIHKICQTTANDNLSPEITKLIKQAVQDERKRIFKKLRPDVKIC